MKSHINRRSFGLPETIRARIAEARRAQGWTQAEFGRMVGMPQAHISGVETGKVIPRFDTILDIVRALGFELLLVERAHVPLVEAMSRAGVSGDRALYGSIEEPGS